MIIEKYIYWYYISLNCWRCCYWSYLSDLFVFVKDEFVNVEVCFELSIRIYKLYVKG